MATNCPIGFDVARLRDQVLATYDHVARAPLAIPCPSADNAAMNEHRSTGRRNT